MNLSEDFAARKKTPMSLSEDLQHEKNSDEPLQRFCNKEKSSFSTFLLFNFIIQTKMEKQVDTISLGKLSNYAHFNYMDAVYKNLNSLLLMGEKLATELPIFEEKLDNENEVLVQSRKNDLTEEIEVGDDQRDSGLSGYAQVLKGFLYLKSGEQYEAAKKLDKHLSDFNLSPRMSLIKQTGAMKNLIEDLETTYTSQVTSLGLTPFVTMMKEGNTAVDTNLQARDARSAGKMKAAVLTARSETDEIYNKIIKKINALAIVDEENADEYGQLIDELNAQIKHYKEQELTPKTKNTDSSSTSGSGTSFKPFYPEYE